MSTPSHSTKAEQLMEREIESLDQTLEDLLTKTVVVKEDKARLVKALKVLTGKATKDRQGRVAPSLQHVAQAARIAFKNQSELSEENLTQRLTQIMQSQPALNRTGMALRIKQFIAACPRSESSGLIIAFKATGSSAE